MASLKNRVREVATPSARHRNDGKRTAVVLLVLPLVFTSYLMLLPHLMLMPFPVSATSGQQHQNYSHDVGNERAGSPNEVVILDGDMREITKKDWPQGTHHEAPLEIWRLNGLIAVRAFPALLVDPSYLGRTDPVDCENDEVFHVFINYRLNLSLIGARFVDYIPNPPMLLDLL